jgi:hypothetical protein
VQEGIVSTEHQVRARVASAIQALDPLELHDSQVEKLRRLASLAFCELGTVSARELLYYAGRAVTFLPIEMVFFALRDEWAFLEELYFLEYPVSPR